MILLRRYIVMIALMFWQGGFTFYASVVVPVGTAALGDSALRQGFITRRVTYWLNIIAAIALVILAIDLLACREWPRWRYWLRWASWLFMAICQASLFYLHSQLDSLMQERGRIILDPEAFHPAHRLYLWIHTAQWVGVLVFMALMLMAWQREEREGV